MGRSSEIPSSRSSGSCQSKVALSALRGGVWRAAWGVIDMSSAAGTGAGGSRALGNDGGRFDLETGAVGDQRADLPLSLDLYRLCYRGRLRRGHGRPPSRPRSPPPPTSLLP